ncbi:hypothetical protein PYV61_22795, partial [Roseisolibacter sp. H3M3-2]
ASWLRRRAPDVVACNPPYVPEPPDAPNALVAGAGPDGARHPKRALAVHARGSRPRVALSWCSLGDPVGVTRAAARRGYVLESLWAAALADGEYTGSALPYYRTLDTAFLDESRATRLALASDGAARFGYLLLAGSFTRGDRDAARPGIRLVSRLVRRFARSGIDAFDGLPVHGYVCDRWDELRLRIAAHGQSN